MKSYEVSNPSDRVTFEAPDDEVATLAVIILGEGAYGATSEDQERVCGIAIFGGIPTNTGGVTEANLATRLEARKLDVAIALESLIYCSISDRAAVKAAGGDLSKWNEAKRSSMTNIGIRAAALAKAMRGQAEVKDGLLAEANRPFATRL